PRFTPSRVPLLSQRWTAIPPDAALAQIVDAGADVPAGAETGVRGNHIGDRAEYSFSFFNGFNHLPNFAGAVKPNALVPEVGVRRRYPAIKTYGADFALPTRWLTVKAETAYFTSGDAATDEYVLYVIQLERQTGEWVLVGGYAGEAITTRR